MILVSFLVVPMLTQWAFRTKAPIPFLVAEWTAGEFLGYAGSISNKEVFQYLFRSLIRSVSSVIVKDELETPEDIVADDIDPAFIMRNAATSLLSNRFYGVEKDPRRDELYETLCLLSSAPYEKSQNRGRLGIATPTALKSDSLIHFTSPIELKKENVRKY